MHSWHLPEREREVTPRIIEILTSQAIQITGWRWKYIPEVGNFYLIITSPTVRRLRPEQVVAAQGEALVAAGVDPKIVERVRLVPDKLNPRGSKAS